MQKVDRDVPARLPTLGGEAATFAHFRDAPVKNQAGCRWVEELLLAALNGDDTRIPQCTTAIPDEPKKSCLPKVEPVQSLSLA